MSGDPRTIPDPYGGLQSILQGVRLVADAVGDVPYALIGGIAVFTFWVISLAERALIRASGSSSAIPGGSAPPTRVSVSASTDASSTLMTHTWPSSDLVRRAVRRRRPCSAMLATPTDQRRDGFR